MTDIEMGGIYRVVAMACGIPSVLALVTDFDEVTQSVTVILLSPDIEFGSSADLLLSSDETGRAYNLLAESDIFGYAWVVQVDRYVGRVGPQVMKVLAVLREGCATTGRLVAPPVVVPDDPRWNFKMRELKRLQAITADCTRELIEMQKWG